MKTAQRLTQLGTENAFEVLSEVQRLQASGQTILSFAIGEPDFDTPDNVKHACIRAILENHTHYSPSAGLPVFREVIAAHIAKSRKITVDKEEVLVTPGGKPIIYHTLHALINPGDEVLYPNPGFPIYESVIRFLGGVPIPIPLLEEKNFAPDLAKLTQLITPRTKMIILNSPHNPTGGVLTKEDLTAIADLALRHKLWILSDEIYSRIIYEGSFHSIISLPGLKEQTILLDGFSKTYAMTGWRLGYGIMPRHLVNAVAQLITNCESCTNTFIQHAGMEALTGSQDFVKKMVAEFKVRRDLIVNGLNQLPGFSCQVPSGAFYAFPNVTKACENLGFFDAKELQQYLLHKAGVATLPRSAFGQKNSNETEEYLRFSYATSQTTIRKGLEKLSKALHERV
ncbi:MAG: pyridoxal phosphate-dependent aminotransferase [Sporomusaceae bacterium]|nr:pyridoxal phosphate-dependent aminotransferase [Sporomusaceae bacterium]